MKKDLSPIRKMLRRDPRCRRLLSIFSESSIYKIPFQELEDEIMTIQKARPIRTLIFGHRVIERIVEASMDDQSKRSRLAEITMEVYKAKSSLESALSKLQEYLLMVYGQEISGFRTKDERKQIIEYALRPLYDFVGKCTRLQELATIAITDIDKGAWSLERNLKAYELHNRPEHTV